MSFNSNVSSNQNVEMAGEFDPDLPTASAVLVSLSCVAARYAVAPSEDLAMLACSLAQTLTAPEYAESDLVMMASRQLLAQWQDLLDAHRHLSMEQATSAYIPQALTVQ